jgi:hypothetical protein
MVSSVASYRRYAAELPAVTARTAARPDVKQATAAFEKAVAKVGTLDDFMADKTAYGFALDAFGLSDSKYAKALVRGVLAGGTERGSLAMRIPDDRFRELAATFTFDSDGNATFDASDVAEAKDAYVRLEVEETAGGSSEGARLALYFQRRAEGFVSVYSILADTNLLTVARTALGIPASTSNMTLDAQASMLGKRLDVAELRDDPKKLASFLDRFAARFDAQSSRAVDSPVVTLLASLRATSGSAISGLVGTLASR